MIRRSALVVLTAAALVLPGCAAATRVESSLSFRADRRLHMTAPEDGAEVRLPLTVRWRASDFPLTGGRRFAVYLDRAPVGPDKTLRWRYCTTRERQPVVPGEARRECHDDRTKITVTDTPEVTFSCMSPRADLPERRRDTHTVTVVLLDGNDRRVGRAAARRTFSIEADSVKPCPLPTD
jgi:hypothetical protein